MTRGLLEHPVMAVRCAWRNPRWRIADGPALECRGYTMVDEGDNA